MPKVNLISEMDDASLAFREVAANVLRFLRGEPDINLVEPMERFLKAFKPVERNGGPIMIVNLQPISGDDDEAINTMLCGAMKMIAAVVQNMDVNEKEYLEGRDQAAVGVVMLDKKARANRKVIHRLLRSKHSDRGHDD